MSHELVAWLREQVDADEQLARSQDLTRAGDPFRDASGIADVDGFPSYPWGAEAHELAFMAGPGHPARVLAEVAAKRGLITQALRWMALRDGEWGCCHDPSEIAAGTCPEEKPDEDRSLRLLASVYAGRPGWRSDWAPDEGGSGA